MLILYMKETCPYSLVAIHKFESLNVPVELRNVHNNRHAIELIERGGRFQVPCLFDTDTGNVIYESEDIMDKADEYAKNRTKVSKT